MTRHICYYEPSIFGESHMPELISPNTLKELIAANAIRSATVIGEEGGYIVAVKYGMTERLLAARTREGIIKRRLFRSLDAASRYLRQIGVPRYEVDETGYKESIATRKRPDRSAALKRTHEAAAYDKWFREQVQAALDDPRPSIPNEEVKARWKVKRAELGKRIKAGQGTKA
jgi:Stability determinant